MSPRRLLLDGRIRSETAFYEALVAAFPEIAKGFGANLDALWDVLTANIEGPIHIVWREANQSASTMGPGFRSIVEVLREAEAKRRDLTVTIEEN